MFEKLAGREGFARFAHKKRQDSRFQFSQLHGVRADYQCSSVGHQLELSRFVRELSGGSRTPE